MASRCRRCYADITWAEVVGTDPPVKVPLDKVEANAGNARYRVVENGQVPKVEKVPETSAITAQLDHRTLCGQPVGIG